jgi:hypothetical protein
MLRSDRIRLIRYPAMALAIGMLLLGIWTGLNRLGLGLPSLGPQVMGLHGPLMITGFLGTLISLERAVALNQLWTYLVPLTFATGTLLLLAGIPESYGIGLIVIGSLGKAAIFLKILYQERTLYNLTLVTSTLVFLLANILWMRGWLIPEVVPFWTGFLILQIAGERLELSRFFTLKTHYRVLFGIAGGIYLVGVLSILAAPEWGFRLAGLGLLALALWLLRYDGVRKTIRFPGLNKYMAMTLLTGYAWLVIAGTLMMVYGPLKAGFAYDALLHAIFLGFVFSMIFAHAPIILPAIAGRKIPFMKRFYGHLALMHMALIVRVIGDLLHWEAGRHWGGVGNALAILWFIANTAWALSQSQNKSEVNQ